MKIMLLSILFLLPLMMFGQDAKIEISGPIENHYGQIYGNEDVGFIKIFEMGNDITIYGLDKDKLTYISEKVYKGLTYKTRRHGFKVIGNGIYLFYQNVEKMIIQENLYYSKINSSTAEMDDPKLLVNTEDFDKNEKYGWYKYDIKYIGDYVYIKSYANENKINYRVLDENLNKEFETNFEYDDKIDLNLNFSYLYDGDNLHILSLYQEKIIDKAIPPKSNFVIFSLPANDGAKEEIEIEFSESEGLNHANLFELEDGRIVLQGIRIEGMNVSAQVYDVNDDFKLISETEHKLSYHINMDDKLKQNMDLSSFNFKNIYLSNNDLVVCYNLDVNYSPAYPSTFRYYVVTKFSSKGEALFCNSVAAGGYRNLEYNKFLITADEQTVNFVFMDRLEKVTIKGKEYDGDYIKAYSLNKLGDFKFNKSFEGEKYRDYKFQYAFRDGIVKNINTFSCHAFKKNKEDLILTVKFEN